MANENEKGCCGTATQQYEADAPEKTLTLEEDDTAAWDEFVGVKAALSMIALIIDDGDEDEPFTAWCEKWKDLSADQQMVVAYFLTNVSGSATVNLPGNPRDRLMRAGATWLFPSEVSEAPKPSDTVTTLPATGPGS